jgi:Holliday junction resolvasome RuvABC endonuclease subunit
MKKLIALDVAYTNIGWAIITPYTGRADIIAVGTVENKADTSVKKRGIRDSDVKIERIQKLFRGIREVVQEYGPMAVIAEIPGGGGKSSRSVAGMAMGTAVVAALVEVEGLPAEWTTEGEGKIAVCRDKTASKIQMQKAILKKYPSLKGMVPKGKTSLGVPGWFEHSADAIAAYEAAKYGMLVKMLAKDNDAGGMTF